MKPTLTLLALPLLYASYMVGYGAALRERTEAASEVARLHGERDAMRQVECALAVVAATEWRTLATRAVQAQYGPFILTEGE